MRKGVFFFLAVMFAGTCYGTETQYFVTSRWSPSIEGLRIRISSPPVIAASREGLDFFVKCEVQNTGKSNKPVVQRAGIFLVEKSGTSTGCLRHSAGVYELPLLKPGESTTWWQHGRAPRTGKFQLYVRWDGKEGVQSPKLPVSVVRSEIASGKQLGTTRDRLLQEHADDFESLSLHTNPRKVIYSKVSFPNDPLIIDGYLYNAISFIVPKPGGALMWSLVVPDPLHNRLDWYILPAQGSMQGFRRLLSKTMKRDVPGVGRKGDVIVFQRLAKSRLKPNQRYLIWFRCLYRDVPHVVISLNMAKKDTVPFKDFFSGIFLKAGL